MSTLGFLAFSRFHLFGPECFTRFEVVAQRYAQSAEIILSEAIGTEIRTEDDESLFAGRIENIVQIDRGAQLVLQESIFEGGAHVVHAQGFHVALDERTAIASFQNVVEILGQGKGVAYISLETPLGLRDLLCGTLQVSSHQVGVDLPPGGHFDGNIQGRIECVVFLQVGWSDHDSRARTDVFAVNDSGDSIGHLLHAQRQVYSGV